MNEPIIIAFLGKGGVGKTVLSALTGNILSAHGKKVLFVDADPAMGLTSALDVSDIKTIGTAREEIIRQARISNSSEEKEQLAEIVDYLLMEALYEGPDFGMVAMGQTNTLGCYCPINNLLRSTIKEIASQYEVVIIDAEAGIEQVNRQVVESVHYPVIVTDNSKRGTQTAVMIFRLLKKVPLMTPVKVGVVFNRVDKADEALVKMVLETGMECYGGLKPDPAISELDRQGISIANLDGTSFSRSGMKSILEQMDIFGKNLIT
ncbi:MAG: AAA family ATPase [Smithella sp.]|jgi:CO dehydrogenase maturation factor